MSFIHQSKDFSRNNVFSIETIDKYSGELVLATLGGLKEFRQEGLIASFPLMFSDESSKVWSQLNKDVYVLKKCVFGNKEILLAYSSKGLHSIENINGVERVTLFGEGIDVYSIFQSRVNPNRIFAASPSLAGTTENGAKLSLMSGGNTSIPMRSHSCMVSATFSGSAP